MTIRHEKVSFGAGGFDSRCLQMTQCLDRAGRGTMHVAHTFGLRGRDDDDT